MLTLPPEEVLRRLFWETDIRAFDQKKPRFECTCSREKVAGMLKMLGQGSWSRVWRLDQSLALQREVNAGKRLRNEGLEAEVEDLKSGRSAVEERARYGLGMVKPDEIFVQINPAPDSPATGH